MKRLLILLSFVCASAHAEFWTGNQLLAKMKDTHGEQMFALGYVSGVADALTGVEVCIPLGVTVGQVYEMTQALLETNPSERHKSADIFVRAVLLKWPCKPAKPANNRGLTEL